jgi:hypothetical protein
VPSRDAFSLPRDAFSLAESSLSFLGVGNRAGAVCLSVQVAHRTRNNGLYGPTPRSDPPETGTDLEHAAGAHGGVGPGWDSLPRDAARDGSRDGSCGRLAGTGWDRPSPMDCD